jgi:hypothetical protein
MGLLGLFLGLGIALSAYLQARRAGVWSWRRFLGSVVVLGGLGGVAGFLAVRIGRRVGPDRAGIVALTTALLIIVAVFALALRLRRRGIRKG